MKSSNDTIRIYIGNGEIAGYFGRLEKGFSRLGIQADFWPVYKNRFRYQKSDNRLIKLHQWLFSLYKSPGFFPKLLRPLPLFIMLILNLIIFIHALANYNVFILNYQHLFNYLELPVLKFFRKKIIFVFFGSDIRPAYLSGNYIKSKFSGEKGMERCHKHVRNQVRMVRMVERYADYIINHPPTGLYHTRPFISWLNIGFPSDDENGVNNAEPNAIPYGIHAPSDRLGKGTDKIQEILFRLHREGLLFKLEIVENKPNRVVLEKLKKCDFVIDELYSDIPLGGLGIEAAFYGKMVFNSGYYARYIRNDHDPDVIPPDVFCEPHQLENQLRNYLAGTEHQRTGQKLSEFVKRRYLPESVASKYLQLISGRAPMRWFYHPLRINFFLGYGIEKEELRTFLRSYVKKYGIKELYISNSELLLDRLLFFLHEPADA